MYRVQGRSGSSFVQAPDKITFIGDEAAEYYVKDVIPRPVGSISPTLMQAETIKVTPLSIVSGEIVSGDEYSFKAQVELDKNKEQNAAQGAQTPKTRGRLIARAAGRGVNKLLEIVFTDSLEGLMFPGLFSVQYIPKPTMTGGNPALYQDPTPTPGTPIDIELQFIETTEQASYAGGSKQVIGDAVINFTRDQLTQAQILTDGSFFDITALGGSPIRYQVWNGSEGLKQEQTYHWCVYLKRVRK